MVYAVGTRQITAIYATLHLRSKPVRFQIDTGASCNVIRMSDLTSIGKISLVEAEKLIRLYDGPTLKPAGTCTLDVGNTTTKKIYRLDFVVIDRAPVALLGAAAGQAMDFVTVHHQKSLSQSIKLSLPRNRVHRWLR